MGLVGASNKRPSSQKGLHNNNNHNHNHNNNNNDISQIL